MRYDFPPDLQSRFEARLGGGAYASEDDLLRDALDALDRLEEDKLTRWVERNALSQEQSRQGLSKEIDDTAVLKRLRDRLRDEGIVG